MEQATTKQLVPEIISLFDLIDEDRVLNHMRPLDLKSVMVRTVRTMLLDGGWLVGKAAQLNAINVLPSWLLENTESAQLHSASKGSKGKCLPTRLLVVPPRSTNIESTY